MWYIMSVTCASVLMWIGYKIGYDNAYNSFSPLAKSVDKLERKLNKEGRNIIRVNIEAEDHSNLQKNVESLANELNIKLESDEDND